MKKSISWLMAIVFVVAIAAVACNSDSAPKTVNESISQDSLIRRGEYLVTVGGCDDCHTPKKMGPQGPELDMENRFAGHLATAQLPAPNQAALKEGWVLFNFTQTAAVGPWGISYAANLSSDSTGIGGWTEAQFFTALRKGLYKGLEGSRPLLPPMPWMNLKNLTDQDTKAIFAYLKSTKPVKNVVPEWTKPNG